LYHIFYALCISVQILYIIYLCRNPSNDPFNVSGAPQSSGTAPDAQNIVAVVLHKVWCNDLLSAELGCNFINKTLMLHNPRAIPMNRIVAATPPARAPRTPPLPHLSR
jgi:hypothetical protein